MRRTDVSDRPIGVLAWLAAHLGRDGVSLPALPTLDVLAARHRLNLRRGRGSRRGTVQLDASTVPEG